MKMTNVYAAYLETTKTCPLEVPASSGHLVIQWLDTLHRQQRLGNHRCLCHEVLWFQSIGVPSLRRGWRPWCAIRFCQVPSHCTVPYSFSSSRSHCQSSSFFFVLCLFFHPPCPPTLIFVRNGAIIGQFLFLDTQNKFRIFQAYHF